MRQTKFRYTFKINSTGLIIVKIYSIVQLENGDFAYWAEINNIEDSELISRDESSGMLDKNNREIFENDKYKWHRNTGESEVGTIIFLDGGFWCQSKNGRYPLYAMLARLEIIDN